MSQYSGVSKICSNKPLRLTHSVLFLLEILKNFLKNFLEIDMIMNKSQYLFSKENFKVATKKELFALT